MNDVQRECWTKSAQRYAAVFGRAPFIQKTASEGVAVDAYGFPPLRRSLWRGLVSEAHDATVYVTAGLSSYSLTVPPEEQSRYPLRIELLATCDGQITGGPENQEDIVTSMLLMVAEYVVDSRIFLGVGHTLDFQERFATNVEMSAFLFVPPEGMDERRLCRCTEAQAILSVVPITAAELAVARQQGVGQLIEMFEQAKVRPVFDITRGCAAS